MANEFRSILFALNENNKVRINLLTFLADENPGEAAEIVRTILQRIEQAPVQQKLPALYTMDSILKNIQGDAFALEIRKIVVKAFVATFQAADEGIRAQLFKLRRTWADYFPRSKLYELDSQVKQIDPAWPVTATTDPSRPAPAAPAPVAKPQHPIRINPAFVRDGRITLTPDGGIVCNNVPKTATTKPQQLQRSTQSALPPKQTLPTKNDHSKQPVVSAAANPPKNPAPPISTAPRHPSAAPRPPLRTEHPEKKRKVEEIPHPPTNKSAPTIIKPTNAPGAHAFAVPALPPRTLPPPPIVRPGPPIHPMHQPPLPPISKPNVMPSSSQPMPSTTPFVQPTSSADPMPAQPPAPARRAAVITDATVRLNIPSNNRIFVDGKAHEVFFIENQAVIERNGQPHKVYFSGPPRNIVIDGTVHSLPFGTEKNVLIDGEEHTIKFGAPSRELIMGGYPFRGTFGGSPIFATINGQRHEIRLSGPPPEVKIEPTPAYELARFMPANRPNATMLKVEKEDNGLARLASLLESVKTVMKANPPPTTVVAPNPPLASPVAISAKGIERRKHAPSLKEFSVQSLKIRYDNVVDALLEKRDCCQHCGIRQSLFKSYEKLNKHLDNHIQQNLNLLQTESNCRPWSYLVEDWIKHSGLEEEEDQPSEQPTKSEKVIKKEPIKSLKTDDAFCASCSYEFKKEFDEEEEDWVLQDCVEHSGKMYHERCLMNATFISETDNTQKQDSDDNVTIVKDEPAESTHSAMPPATDIKLFTQSA